MIKIIISVVVPVVVVLACIILLYRLVVAAYWHVQGMKLRRHLDLFDDKNPDFIVDTSFKEKDDNN